MRIALLGGTGDIGAGLALRWGLDTDHELLVGSRDPERARERAADYEATLADLVREGGELRRLMGLQAAPAPAR